MAENQTGSGMYHPIVKEQDFLTGRKGNRQSAIIAMTEGMSTHFHAMFTNIPPQNPPPVENPRRLTRRALALP
jgi:hypothetical protein